MAKFKKSFFPVIIFFALFQPLRMLAQPALENQVIGAGGTTATDGKFQITATIGLSNTGITHSKYIHQSGFWYQWKALPYANAMTVLIADNISVDRGRQARIPIVLDSDPVGLGIIAFQLSLEYDPLLLKAIGLSTEGSLTSTDWTVTGNTSQAGRISVLAFSVTPLSAPGTLVVLNFQVAENAPAGTTSAVQFTQFFFNEGEPMALTRDGSVIVQSAGNLLIAGKVGYGLDCGGQQPVPNTTVILSGDSLAKTSTNLQGAYQFLLNKGGNFRVSASKDGDANGISALDAARVAQYGVGLFSFDKCQMLAADVTGNGQITAFDAARIAQFSASLPHQSLCGTWTIRPDTIRFIGLKRDTTAVNFTAILYGEVTGNWQATGSSGKASDSTGVDSEILLRIADVTSNQPDQVVIPIRMQNNSKEKIFATQFTVDYPDQLMAFDRASGPDSVTMVVNNTENGLRIVLYSIAPIADGDVCQLFFKPLVKFRQSETLQLRSALVNESSPRTESGSVRLMTAPERYYLAQNSPNPFNPITRIHFELPASGQVQLKIYDIGGRKVRTLVHENKEAGYHNVTWDGTDDLGRPVSSGIYFYRIEAGERFHAVKRMVFIK